MHAWVSDAPAVLCAISVVTVLEPERGILLVERRDAMQAAVSWRWLEGEIVTPLADRILSIDTAMAWRCVSLYVPDPRPERDTLIAATAPTLGLIVVTRNVEDFEPLRATFINRWLAAGA